MKTKDILTALRKNRIVTQIIPEWACRSVPFPFFCNGVPYLGLYYYPIRRQNNETRTFTPILQFVIAHKDGHVVSAVASPFFLKPEEDSKAEIGTYPNPALKDLTFTEAEATYDRYFDSCDEFLEGGAKEKWRSEFEKVCEPGFETFFGRFAKSDAIVPVKGASISQSQPVKQSSEKPSEIMNPSNPTNRELVANPAELDSAIADLKKLLANTPFQSRLEELGKIQAASRRHRFNVAVVGEFSRGKSTFLNDLLGDGPLPTGGLPTTAVPAKITGGDVRKAVFLEQGKRPQVVNCTAESLATFAADAEGRDPNGVLELQVDSEWLKGQPIAIFDTPGVGDSVGVRAQLARATIAGCDCTIVAVAANAACSQTELAFIRDAIVAKRIPRVAVLLTKLDTIPEDERARVVTFVHEKIKPVAPEAELWLPHPIQGLLEGCAHCVGLDAIRTRLAQFAASDDIASRRLRQKAQAVSELATIVASDLEVVEKAEKMTAEQRQNVAKAISEKRESFKLFSDELSAECEREQVVTELWVRDELNKIRDGLIEDFGHSLRSYRGDMKHWAEEDFPYQAKKEIPRRIREQFGPKLEARISAFSAKLAKTASSRFSAAEFSIPSASFADLTGMHDIAGLEVDDREIKNIQTGSLVAKVVAVPVAMIGLMLVGGPVGLAYGIGAAATAGAGVLGGKLADKKSSDLRAELERKIQDNFQRIFDEQMKNITDLVRKTFSKVWEMLKLRLEESIESALSALNMSDEKPADGKRFDSAEFSSKLERIQKRIHFAAAF